MDISSLNGTLTTHAFYILLAIADRPMHGYGIRDQIVTDSQGEVIIPTGSLYPALRRLVETRLIEKIDAVTTHSRTTCRYRITTQGKNLLKAEAIRLSKLPIHARYKLGEQVLRP
jgi:DNA-binding PadR family transcriptional regulator